MSVARFSCPQLLDARLRTTQTPVDQERVGVGCYLRRDPGCQPYQRGGQRLAQAKDPLEARDGDLYVLPGPVAPFRALGSQEDANLRQGLPQILASVGQVSQEPPRHFASQSRLGNEFLSQANVCDVGGGEFVGDGDAAGGAEEVQLNSVDAERTPPHPRGSIETRRLRNLARMQDFEQGGVYEQGLRIAHQFGEDLAAQGLQIAPELPQAPVEGGRVQPRYPREQMGEEPLGISQERAFALHTPQLLQEGEGDDLGVREALYGLVASSAAGVEEAVGVVYEAEKHCHSLFQVGERVGMLGSGHPRFLSSRVRMALVVPSIHATHI